MDREQSPGVNFEHVARLYVNVVTYHMKRIMAQTIRDSALADTDPPAPTSDRGDRRDESSGRSSSSSSSSSSSGAVDDARRRQLDVEVRDLSHSVREVVEVMKRTNELYGIESKREVQIGAPLIHLSLKSAIERLGDLLRRPGSRTHPAVLDALHTRQLMSGAPHSRDLEAAEVESSDPDVRRIAHVFNVATAFATAADRLVTLFGAMSSDVTECRHALAAHLVARAKKDTAKLSDMFFECSRAHKSLVNAHLTSHAQDNLTLNQNRDIHFERMCKWRSKMTRYLEDTGLMLEQVYAHEHAAIYAFVARTRAAPFSVTGDVWEHDQIDLRGAPGAQFAPRIKWDSIAGEIVAHPGRLVPKVVGKLRAVRTDLAEWRPQRNTVDDLIAIVEEARDDVAPLTVLLSHTRRYVRSLSERHAASHLGIQAKIDAIEDQIQALRDRVVSRDVAAETAAQEQIAHLNDAIHAIHVAEMSKWENFNATLQLWRQWTEVVAPPVADLPAFNTADAHLYRSRRDLQVRHRDHVAATRLKTKNQLTDRCHDVTNKYAAEADELVRNYMQRERALQAQFWAEWSRQEPELSRKQDHLKLFRSEALDARSHGSSRSSSSRDAHGGPDRGSDRGTYGGSDRGAYGGSDRGAYGGSNSSEMQHVAALVERIVDAHRMQFRTLAVKCSWADAHDTERAIVHVMKRIYEIHDAKY